MNEHFLKALKTVGFEYRHDPKYGQVLVNFTMRDAEKFAELIREDIMQELFINGYEDAFDHLNEYFGDEE